MVREWRGRQSRGVRTHRGRSGDDSRRVSTNGGVEGSTFLLSRPLVNSDLRVVEITYNSPPEWRVTCTQEFKYGLEETLSVCLSTVPSRPQVLPPRSRGPRRVERFPRS